jgi:predicted porin
MKIALSLSMLALAGSAYAQSGVQVYGVVDAFGQVLDGDSRIARLTSGGQSGSRLGFRGSEDLGGGLRANFTLESGINLDDGTVGQGGVFYGRQAFVGLQGAFGALSLGRQYSSVFAATTEFSEFGNQPAGPSTAVIGGFGGDYEPVRGASATAAAPAGGGTGNGGPARVNNSVRYESPSWNGLRASALYGAGEITGATSEARLIDLGVRYTVGGLALLLSHVDDRAVRTSGVSGTDAATTTLAGSYSFAPFRVVGGYLSFNDKRPANEDGRGFWIGADHRVENHVFKAQFIRNKPRSGSDNETDAFGVGWVYELSKRTAIYSSLTRFNNDRLAGSGGLGRLNGSTPAGVTRLGDNSVNEYALGIRQSF